MNNIYRQATIFHPENIDLMQNNQQESWVILCDFDGTISLADVTDVLLTKFGKPGHEELEDKWLNGEIGSRACMSGQIALIDADKHELDTALASIDIDPDFKHFVQHAKKLGIPVKIISDGLDYAIKHILKPHGLDNLPIYANRFIQTAERSWQLEFPHASENCVKASGNCKCARVAAYQSINEKVLFVGDGSSDFCASGKVDFVLAKDKLIQHCIKQGTPHLAINGFAEALDYITETLPNQLAFK